jgi:hypothetical protein
MKQYLHFYPEGPFCPLTERGERAGQLACPYCGKPLPAKVLRPTKREVENMRKRLFSYGAIHLYDEPPDRFRLRPCKRKMCEAIDSFERRFISEDVKALAKEYREPTRSLVPRDFIGLPEQYWFALKAARYLDFAARTEQKRQ